MASPVMVYDAPPMDARRAKPASTSAAPSRALAENDAFASRIAGGGVETASASRWPIPPPR
jgi:type IV secretion system protein VirB10